MQILNDLNVYAQYQLCLITRIAITQRLNCFTVKREYEQEWVDETKKVEI